MSSTSVESSHSLFPAPNSNQALHQFRGNKGSRSGHNRRGRGRFYGSTIKCQVFFKFDHTTLTCWYMFNQSYNPSVLAGNPYTHGSRYPSIVGYGSFSPNVSTRPLTPTRNVELFSDPPSAFLANFVPTAYAS